MGRTLVASKLLAGSACGKRQVVRPLNSGVRCRVSMITVARFFNVQSADLARIALEGSGVPVFLESEGYAQLTNIPAIAGGVRVQVPVSRVEDARAILRSLAEEQGGELY